jgi:ABC-type nitrate/sulfonate/bicarbonate transport system permease component
MAEARRRRPSALKREVAIPALAVLVLVVMWEVLVRAFKVPEFLLPAPSTALAPYQYALSAPGQASCGGA